MKKSQKFIVSFASFALLGGVYATLGTASREISEAKAETLSITMTPGYSNANFGVVNGTKGGLYLNAEANDIYYTTDWNTRYTPTSVDCIKLNGESIASTVHKHEGSLAKTNGTDYYLALGYYFNELGLPLDNGSVVTVSGTWTGTFNDTTYTFTINKNSFLWNGTNWIVTIEDNDLEIYDRLTLRDAGIFNHEHEDNLNEGSFSTEDNGTESPTSNWVPTKGNVNNNFVFSFGFQSYTDDYTGTNSVGNNKEFVLRIGSQHYGSESPMSGWDYKRYFQVAIYTQYGGDTGCFTFQEWEDGKQLWNPGDINRLTKTTKFTLTVGNINLKDESGQYSFVEIDGIRILGLVRSTVSTTKLSNHIGFYHSYNAGASCSIRNAWGLTKKDCTTGDIPTKGETTGGAPNGLYLDLPENGTKHGGGVWNTYYYPADAENILLNGKSFYGYKKVAICKYTANHHYVRFADYGYQTLINDGDIITIRGKFRNYFDGVMQEFSIPQTSFKRNGDQWEFYDIGYLGASTIDDLPADSFIRNIGKYNPEGTKSSIKGFDQTPDTLDYRYDENGNTGLYFTSDENDTGEVRFYFPGNGYKSEGKGHAIRSISFDYALTDANTEVGTEGGTSLTPDGYYIPAQGASTTTSYMVQLMDKDSNHYFCFDAPLVADGNLHTFTLNVAYGDVTGFTVKLFRHSGLFFISNIVADYNTYDEALDNLVHDSLKMYDYYEGNACVEYYPAAKAAYNALSDAQKELFTTDRAYASAYARLVAWAAASGDSVTVSGITKTPTMFGNNDSNNASTIVAIAASVIALSAAGLVFIKKRRSHK